MYMRTHGPERCINDCVRVKNLKGRRGQGCKRRDGEEKSLANLSLQGMIKGVGSNVKMGHKNSGGEKIKRGKLPGGDVLGIPFYSQQRRSSSCSGKGWVTKTWLYNNSKWQGENSKKSWGGGGKRENRF